MYRCLIWGTGKCLTDNFSTIRIHEELGNIKVTAVTSNADFLSYGNYPFVKKEFIRTEDYEIIIIMVYDKRVVNKIKGEILNKGFEEYQIIPYHVIGKLGFTFDGYQSLARRTPSIFAPNCWGGITYNYLGLKFCSPLINMFESHTDYLKLLKKPEHYMQLELEPDEMCYECNLKREYPVVKCGDIRLHFNHYVSFEDANRCWERRKKRIDWDNLFVMDFEEDPDLAQEFSKLPYKRKVCFVTFPANEPSLIYIDYRKSSILKEKLFYEIVNGMARGDYLYYDVFQLLSSGEAEAVSSFL